MAYTMHRVFCSTPGDLEPERRIFSDAVGEFNETTAIAQGILFVPLSIVPHMGNLSVFQEAIAANLRASSFFLQVLHDTWGAPPRNFRPIYDLAQRLVTHADSGLRGGVAFFKTGGARRIEPEVSALKTSLEVERDWPVFSFSNAGEFTRQLRAQLTAWFHDVACSLPESRPATGT